ncbi:MAG: DUF1365 family protein [Hyphomicrobiaceae bacterium]|nr:DUF1365 family protein [Hyphomicrobiaceae bacterium]
MPTLRAGRYATQLNAFMAQDVPPRAGPPIEGTNRSDPDPSSTTALELTFQLDHRLRAGHHPLLTQKVNAGIHWEALRLWSKRLKVRSRPGGR